MFAEINYIIKEEIASCLIQQVNFLLSEEL